MRRRWLILLLAAALAACTNPAGTANPGGAGNPGGASSAPTQAPASGGTVPGYGY